MAEEKEPECGLEIIPNRARSLQAFTEHAQGRGKQETSLLKYAVGMQ